MPGHQSDQVGTVGLKAVYHQPYGGLKSQYGVLEMYR